MAEGSGGTVVAEAGAGSAFLSRDFRLYQTARLLVILGAEAQTIAVAWQVYKITGSALDLGLTGLALFVPGLFFMLAAGHVADRYDRRGIILVCYGLQAVCTLAAAAVCDAWNCAGVADLCGAAGDWHGASVQRAGGERAAAEPGAEGTLRQCGDLGGDRLPDRQISRARRWAGCCLRCRCAGALAGWNGAAVVYAFTLTTLLAFIALVGAMRTRPVRVVKNAFNLETMLAGFRYVWQAKLLLGSISLDLFAVLLGGATALLPIYATDILHAGPRALGLLRAMPSMGALAVSLVMTVRPIKRDAGKLMLFCVASLARRRWCLASRGRCG